MTVLIIVSIFILYIATGIVIAGTAAAVSPELARDGTLLVTVVGWPILLFIASIVLLTKYTQKKITTYLARSNNHDRD